MRDSCQEQFISRCLRWGCNRMCNEVARVHLVLFDSCSLLIGISRMSLLLRSTFLLSVASLLIGCRDSGDGTGPNTSTEKNATAESSSGG